MKKKTCAFLVAMFVAGGCGSKNEIDCEKEPQKAVNNSFSIDGKHLILATSKADDIYNFNQKMRDDLLQKANPSKAKYGDIGAVADITTHLNDYQNVAKKDLRDAVKSGVVSNINTDSQNKMTNDSLQMVVLACAHADSKYPILKVRVVNKKCAGAEVWISAHSLNKYGHLIHYSH